MREFKIYGCIGENPDTLKFRKFMKEVEEKINSDQEIIEMSKKCNLDFTQNLKELLENSENEFFIGSMVAGLQERTQRYSFLKNLECDGKKYEAQIDELERKFYLFEV